MITITTNGTTRRFEVHANGELVFAAKRYLDAQAEYVRLGGVVETPKPMSRSAAYRMEQASRGNSGGWGQSRSGRR